jgi:hypothetical protein
LLSDIRTLIEGGQNYKLKDSDNLDGTFGAGNVSIPILVCIGLELASALYTGKTEVKDHSSYHADENVKDFVENFFPEQGIKIPLILWDGIRNGNNHLFMPNVIKVAGTLIKFTFITDMNPYKLSYVTRKNNTIGIYLNGIEFYRIFKKALEKYGTLLDKDDTLQNHFIEAWESIDNEPHDLTLDRYKIPKEVRRLDSKLQFSNQINLFSLAHDGLLSSSHYQTNPHELTQLLRLILRTL